MTVRSRRERHSRRHDASADGEVPDFVDRRRPLPGHEFLADTMQAPPRLAGHARVPGKDELEIERAPPPDVLAPTVAIPRFVIHDGPREVDAAMTAAQDPMGEVDVLAGQAAPGT